MTAAHQAPLGPRALVAARRRGSIGPARPPWPAPILASAPVAPVAPTLSEAEVRTRALALWEAHGRVGYAVACTLLGHQEDAARTVLRALTGMAQSPSRGSDADERRELVRRVYDHSHELSETTGATAGLPEAMVRLSRLARLQRACLALCLLGSHTYDEAARVLELSPGAVAGALAAGLRELGLSAAGGAGAAACPST